MNRLYASIYETSYVPDHGEHKKENRTALILAIVVTALFPLWRSIWILPPLSQTYYYAAFGLLSLMVMISGRCHMHWSILWFLCWCVASILLNTFTSYFTPWPRLLGLTLIIVGAGPLMANRRLYYWRSHSLNVLLWGFAIISVISFIMYYVARGLVMYQGFLFTGITGNSMLLSPMAGMAALFIMQWYMKRGRQCATWLKVVIWLVWAICLFSSILAGSRSALLSFLISFLVWLWLYLRSVRRFVWAMVITATLVGITSPAWSNYTETIERKTEANQATGGFLSARQTLWDQRWAEFKEKPVFGIGFSKVEKMTDDTDTRTLRQGTGVVEPGNGWLFVLSSTGIGGFLLVLWIYLTMLWKLLRIHSFESRLLLSLLVFLGVHSFAEGYMLSSGNLFCLMFWLCLGVAVCLPRPPAKLRIRL